MDYSWRSFAALCLGLLLVTSFLDATAHAASPVTAAQPGSIGPRVSPEQRLTDCLGMAKEGQVEEAFAQAKQLHETFRNQRLFDVSYINTLISIVDECDSTIEPQILNEVIGLVNQVRVTKQYDGAQDPEVAFHFMKALGRLSQATMEMNERVSSKVRLYEGQIAVNLSKNPKFPKNAVEALSLPLVSMAQGFAIRGNEKAAISALKLAVDNGYGDFETLRKDELIHRVKSDDSMDKLVVDLKVRYKKSVKSWARTVLAGFSQTQIHFDLANINGGRISKNDFTGKVLVLDMWATWCPPCRKGIPHYIKLQNEYRDQNIAVLGVSMDNANDPFSALQTVRNFVAEQKFNYPCALGDLNFSQQIPGESILPTTVFMDPNGNVRYIARGYHDYSKIEAIATILASETQPVQAGMPSQSR